MHAGSLSVYIMYTVASPSSKADPDPPDWLREAESHFRTLRPLCAY